MAYAEIRAYEVYPLAITTTMLSANSMPNTTLVNSLSFSMSTTSALTTDLLFSSVSSGGAVYLMVNFGVSKNIGDVLVIGSP